MLIQFFAFQKIARCEASASPNPGGIRNKNKKKSTKKNNELRKLRVGVYLFPTLSLSLMSRKIYNKNPYNI